MVYSCKTGKMKIDTLYFNAQVYTVDSAFSKVESFAVDKGKIVATGTKENLLTNYEPSEQIDLTGKFVYPGFIDAHCHFYGYGLDLQHADLKGSKSFDEVLERLQTHVQKYKTTWIMGRGWDQNLWRVKEFPTNEQLDKLFPDKPVLLIRVDGHAAIANSEALKRAGITLNTKIDGGSIVSKNGKLTGVLIDNAVELVKNIIPKPNIEEEKQSLMLAQHNCFTVGLTSLSDAGLPVKTIHLIDSLQKAGQLSMRVYAMLDVSDSNFVAFMQKGIYKTDYLNVRSIKMYADGALGSRGALLLQPYSDDVKNTGLSLTPIKQMIKNCKLAYKNNYQVCTHAIGDSANRMMLKIYGNILKTKNDLRWRIEHVQVVNENDFDLFAKFSVIPSVQPTHATSDMYWAEQRLGQERVKGAYAYKQLLQQNGWLAAGSDFPIENINPVLGFYAAVARKDFESKPESGFQKENALTREQALRAMTIWAAKSSFEELEKGSIEVGKFADFVVTDKDLMTTPENDIFNIKVLKTFIGGKCVYNYE